MHSSLWVGMPHVPAVLLMHTSAHSNLPAIHGTPPSSTAPLLAGLTRLQDLNLHGCRNLASPAPGESLAGLGELRLLTSLCMRGCDRLAGGVCVLGGVRAGVGGGCRL